MFVSLDMRACLYACVFLKSGFDNQSVILNPKVRMRGSWTALSTAGSSLLLYLSVTVSGKAPPPTLFCHLHPEWKLYSKCQINWIYMMLSLLVCQQFQVFTPQVTLSCLSLSVRQIVILLSDSFTLRQLRRGNLELCVLRWKDGWLSKHFLISRLLHSVRCCVVMLCCPGAALCPCH